MSPLYLEVVHEQAGRGKNPPFHIERFWRDLCSSFDISFEYRPGPLPSSDGKRDYVVRVRLSGSWDLADLLRPALWRNVLEPCAAPGGEVTAIAVDSKIDGLEALPGGPGFRYDVWSDWADFRERVS